jgi:ubiquinone/menaquinone biosynthesis C-methylase UbiE
MQQTVDLKQRVRAFWDGTPCGSALTDAVEGTAEFFADVEEHRYRAEPFIPAIANFAGWSGKSVLEIGVGLGTDFVRFARAGARVTGIDLSPRSVELVRRRLELESLEGEVLVADAEALPFEDSRFDYVYSWGVLHHTPDTSRAVREAIRVLRPAGQMCVMLYGRRSWVALGTWLRNALLRGRPLQSISTVLAERMESEGTKAFTTGELRQMFAHLANFSIRSVATVYDRRYAGPLMRITGNRLGWFRVVQGQKRPPGAGESSD